MSSRLARSFVWLLCLLTLLDSVLGAAIYKLTGQGWLASLVLYFKYVLFITGFVIHISGLMARGRMFRYETAGLLYLLVVVLMSCLLMVLYPDHPAADRFYIYAFPVVIYFCGAALSQVRGMSLQMCVGTYLKVYLAVNVLCGFVIYAVGDEYFWRDVVSYGSYVVDVKGFNDVLDGLPGNFFFDPNFLRIPRFVGSMGDPLAVGYSAMILAATVWYVYPRHRRVLMLVLITAISLALTRAALMGLLVGFGAYALFRRFAFPLVLAAGIGGLLLVVLFGDVIALLLGDSSTEGHVLSISQLRDVVNPSNFLIGTLGGGQEVLFEPGFLNVLLTYGLVALLPLLIFVGGIVKRHARRGGTEAFVAVVFLGGTVTLAVFSQSFFAITSSWFAWLMAGFMSRERGEYFFIATQAENPLASNRETVSASAH